MPTFDGGTVVVTFEGDQSPFKAANTNIEKLAKSAGKKAARNFSKEFGKGFKGKSLGQQLSADVTTGLNAKRSGTTEGQNFKSGFSTGSKGLFKGLNIGTVFSGIGLGLNVASLAYNVISSSIKAAREEQERFEQAVQDFDLTLSTSISRMDEAERLQGLLENSALSASQRVALLSGEYLTLGQRLSRISFKDKATQLEELREKLQPLQDQREKLFRTGEPLERNRISQEKIQGTSDIPLNPNLKKNREEIAKLNAKLAEGLAQAASIITTKSGAESEAEILNAALAASNKQQDDLRLARIRTDTVAIAAIEDQILLEKKRRDFSAEGSANVEEEAQRYVKAVRDAINEAKRAKDAERGLAEQSLANAQAQQRRNIEIQNAAQLFASTRTPIEQYTAALKDLDDQQADDELNKAANGDDTFNRQRIAELIKLAQATKDSTLVLAAFEKLQKQGVVTTANEVAVRKKLNDVLGITAAEMKALAEQEKKAIELKKQQLFIVERLANRELELARLANDDKEIERLERKLAIQQKIDELVNKGGLSPADATAQANREVAEEDVASARGVFRSGFSDGLRAAIDGDLGSFLEEKLKSLAEGMFDRAIDNLADAVFDQLAQIAPGFLGKITGTPGLANSLTNAGSSVASTATQAAGLGAQAGGAAAASTAITTALTTGGVSAGASIGTSMTVAGTTVAAQIAAAMQAGGLAGTISNPQGLSGNQLSDLVGKIPFFATGGVLKRGLGFVGEEGPELISAGSGPVRITPLDGGFGSRFGGVSTAGLESRGTNQSPSSNIVMNIAGVKDLSSFAKSQGTIEADMAAALRRAQADL